MRPSWKLALIGGEVTVLAAFTGVGIHLAMQPHHAAFRPPPLTLPSLRPAVIPTLSKLAREEGGRTKDGHFIRPATQFCAFIWKMVAIEPRSVMEAKRWIGRIVFGTIGVEMAGLLVRVLVDSVNH